NEIGGGGSAQAIATGVKEAPMCPACIAPAALVVAGATSGGGLAALTMKKLRGSTGAKEMTMPSHTIVSREEWLEARRAHLAREKEFARLRDQLSAERRAMPWVRVDKPYVFERPAGKATLADLFDGRRQLIAYHFMFGPGWEG